MKVRQLSSPLESAALLFQRVIRKRQLPPKYGFLNYIQAIREIKNALIPALASGEFDDHVANCINYAKYNNDRTAMLKLAHVLFAGDRSFNYDNPGVPKCVGKLSSLLQSKNSKFPEIIQTFNETYHAWKQINANKVANLLRFLAETNNTGLAKSYNVPEADRNFEREWISFRSDLLKLNRSLHLKYSTKDLFTVSDLLTLPMFDGNKIFLIDSLECIIKQSIPTTGFVGLAEYEQLKIRSLAGLKMIDQFVLENIDQDNSMQTLELMRYLAPCFELCGFLFEHRASFNNGFEWHSTHEHWNYELQIKEAPPNKLISFSHGGGLFYLTSFFGGSHRGYRGDQGSHRRGIYATPDTEILGFTPPYMDKYYAHVEAPRQFDIPVSFQGKVQVKNLDDAGRKHYEVILTKECVDFVSERKISIY